MAKTAFISGGLKGINEAKRIARDIGAHAVEAFDRQLIIGAHEGMADIQATEVPVKTGGLRRSGRVDQKGRIGDGIQVELAFGGASAPYAVVVHEKHATKSKYLERPMNARVEAIGDDCAAAAKSAKKPPGVK